MQTEKLNKARLPNVVSLAKPPMKILLQEKQSTKETNSESALREAETYKQRERQIEGELPRTGSIDFRDTGSLGNHDEIEEI